MLPAVVSVFEVFQVELKTKCDYSPRPFAHFVFIDGENMLILFYCFDFRSAVFLLFFQKPFSSGKVISKRQVCLL